MSDSIPPTRKEYSIMKKRAVLITLILLFSFVLTACAPSLPPTSLPTPANSKADDISDIIPYLNTPEKVYVYGDYTSYKFFGGTVFVPADKSQSEQIIKLLSSIDMSDFNKCEKSDVLGGGLIEIRIESISGSCNIRILLESDSVSYLVFRFENGESYYFKGDGAAVPFIDLAKALVTVRNDTADTENSASALLLDGSGKIDSLTKVSSATLKNILDGTAKTSDTYKGSGDYVYDLQLTIGETVYQINATTGVFSKKQNGETAIYVLEGIWLNKCYTLLPREFNPMFRD